MFYLGLLLVNVLCFLPQYLLNVRQEPNPIAFLTDDRFFNKNKLKLLYAKPRFSDPFKINFDFTFPVLMLAFSGLSSVWLISLSGVILALGMLEIVYAGVMLYVFKRAPALPSDISLLKAGLSIAHRRKVLFVGAAVFALMALIAACIALSSMLFRLAPNGDWLSAALALLLLPPCFYHWRSYNYSQFQSRTVYSPTLHLIRNLMFSRRFRQMLDKDRDYFDRHNHFKHVVLERTPHIVTICIESYGSVVFRDPSIHAGLCDTLTKASERLESGGFQIASNFSEAPIFTGGSWLSYASFLYGIRLANLQVYDGLFGSSDAFSGYESLFHVLRRNAYRSYLLCPLGGVDSKDVNWDSINRCFQSDFNFDYATLNYRGKKLDYFVKRDTYCAPDQYALNFAYENAKQMANGPFSLFFCTLNSHFPWRSPRRAVEDWRKINDAAFEFDTTDDADASLWSKYIDAVRYQLDFIFEFVERNADDDLVVTVFGDHQPPLLATEQMGLQTPVHLICKSADIVSTFCGHGFVPGLDLAGSGARPMRHEGYLSLFMKSLNEAYGVDRNLRVEYRPGGAELFNE